jgi:outer membrane protein OmpA-like peptidoglycan-associated protein
LSLNCNTYHFLSISIKGLIFILILLFSLNSISQNLFANPGLEDINTCTEYHAPCAPEAWYYIKPTTNPLVNGRVAPRPLLGNNFLLVPVHNVYDTNGTRPFVYSMFACPLVKGSKYKLSFYLNTSKRKFNNLDFYLCEKEPATRYFETKDISPTFTITKNDVIAELKQGWQAIEFYFIATGNENFCMLGNMSKSMDYIIEDKMNASGTVFYFLDEIKLTSIDNIPACDAFEKNVRMMYEQNSRHTDYTILDIERTKPAAPVFIKDTITIPAVFFESGSALLKPSFQKSMDSVVFTLEQKRISKIDISGHTDNKGKPEENLLLSLSRADAVKNYLVKKLPQYSDITFAEGKGQDQPVADNNTAAGRTINRRVEIVLTILVQGK